MCSNISPSSFITEDFSNWWQRHFSNIAKPFDECFALVQTGTAELKST
ncbi:hypothetical protein A2U01_0085455, partial [Trifolium medium]|nr:hypothetical protein [Trifolium medium]